MANVMDMTQDFILPRIVHLTYSSNGGAGRAAADIVMAQSNIGLNADLKVVSASNVGGKPLEHPLVTSAAMFDRYIVAKSNKDLFTLTRSNIGVLDEVLKLPSETIINLHWLPGALSIRQLTEIGKKFSKVFWTLHDFRAVTGGCHYPGACKGFQRECGQCPLVRKKFWGMTEASQTGILNAFDRGNLKLICPSEGLREAVSKSRLGKSTSISKIGLVGPVTGAPTEANEHRKKNGHSVFIFAAADASEHRKGLREALEWWRRAPREKGAELWLAGKGSETFSNPSQNVFGFGQLAGNELAKKMEEASYLVFSSTEDNSPLVVHEAISNNLIVLCLDPRMSKWLRSDGVFCLNPRDVGWQDLGAFYLTSLEQSREGNSRFLDERGPLKVARAYAELYSQP